MLSVKREFFFLGHSWKIDHVGGVKAGTECIDKVVTSLGSEAWIMDSEITDFMSSFEYVK